MGAAMWLAVAGWSAALVAVGAAVFSARAARDARRSAGAADRQASAADVTRRQAVDVERDQDAALAAMAEIVRKRQLRRLEDNYAACQKLISTVTAMLTAADMFIDLRASDGARQWHETFMREMALLIPRVYEVQLHAYTDELTRAVEETIDIAYKMLESTQRMRRGEEAASVDYLDGLELLAKVSTNVERHATDTVARSEASASRQDRD